MQIKLTFWVVDHTIRYFLASSVIGDRRAKKHRVVRMGLDMFFQVLGSFECFAAEVALMWLQWHMDPDVRGNMISLDRRGATVSPLTGQVQIVGRLATNMLFTDVFLFCC